MSDDLDAVRAIVLTGTVHYQRSVSKSIDCLCCEGQHVCSYGLNLDPEAPEWVRAKHVDTAKVLDHLDPVMFLSRYLYQQPEGSRVRVTVETIWTPGPPKGP